MSIAKNKLQYFDTKQITRQNPQKSREFWKKVWFFGPNFLIKISLVSLLLWTLYQQFSVSKIKCGTPKKKKTLLEDGVRIERATFLDSRR